jgi:hypothetical protein
LHRVPFIVKSLSQFFLNKALKVYHRDRPRKKRAFDKLSDILATTQFALNRNDFPSARKDVHLSFGYFFQAASCSHGQNGAKAQANRR